eukprot:GAHX01000345.1.p1 GENE.GAHX01000345.1~~GAHX01000345.1.p1  ORF type:complete len:773 (-),score=137.20 GAHX01000345.1:50-2368(-)
MICNWYTDLDIPAWFNIGNFKAIELTGDNEEYINKRNKQLGHEDWKFVNTALEELIGTLLPKLNHKSEDRISLITINSLQKNLISCISNPRSKISSKACILLALISQVYGNRFISESFNIYIPFLLANINTKVAVIAKSASLCMKLALCYSGLSHLQTSLLEILKTNIKNKAPLIRIFISELLLELSGSFDKDIENNRLPNEHIPNSNIVSLITVSSFIDNHSEVRQNAVKTYQVLRKYIDSELEKQLNLIAGSRKKLKILLSSPDIPCIKKGSRKIFRPKNRESKIADVLEPQLQHESSPDNTETINRKSDEDIELLFSSPNSKAENMNISINEDIKKTKTKLFEDSLPLSPNLISKFYMKVKEKINPDSCIVHNKHDFSLLYKHNELNLLMEGFDTETLENNLTVFSERQADPTQIICSCPNSTEPFIRGLKSKVLTQLNIDIIKIVLTTKLLPDARRHFFYLKTLEHLDDLSLPEETRITLRNIISKYNEYTTDDLLHSICEAQVLSKTLTEVFTLDSSLNSSIIKSLSELRDEEVESDMIESYLEYLEIDSLSIESPQKYITHLVDVLKNLQNDIGNDSHVTTAKWYACCVCIANYVKDNPENVSNDTTNDLFNVFVETFRNIKCRSGIQVVMNVIKHTRIFDKSFKIFECLNGEAETNILPFIICLETVIGNLEFIKRETPEVDFKVEEEYFIDAFLNSKLTSFDKFGIDIKNSIYNLISRMSFVFGKYFLDDQRFSICSSMFLLKHTANEYLEKDKCAEIDIMLYD